MCEHQDRIDYKNRSWSCSTEPVYVHMHDSSNRCYASTGLSDWLHTGKSMCKPSHQRAVLNCRTAPLASLDGNRCPEHSDPSSLSSDHLSTHVFWKALPYSKPNCDLLKLMGKRYLAIKENRPGRESSVTSSWATRESKRLKRGPIRLTREAMSSIGHSQRPTACQLWLASHQTGY